ncbi:CsxC family protein [Metabacillus arenae]|uniref:Uncharacterized protein n=1 Tax=Metabacillus arenae TaxID=2771434 RepID=A0A926NJX2_9BACI|nr:hypothetical protein [Metabacillus arenae]MBD1381943.1 hypothetical protein [Metabacillus arenae]
MKKNTGCGCNDHHNSCPPAMQCDKADTKTVECDNKSFKPERFPKQKVPVIDVPVVLAEVELLADVEANIKLPSPAREIKWIRKNISLKQCKAFVREFDRFKAKVFITGVVHKNIQYVEDCSGFVRDYSVDVPFSCNQTVKLFNPAVQFFSRKSSIDEYRFLDKDGHGADRCTFGSFTDEDYNEPIECKLIFSEITELDLLKDFDHFGRFKKITEKMEVLLFFKLLQTQQFDPRKFDHDHCDDDHGDGDDAAHTDLCLRDRIKMRRDRNR